MKLAAEVKFKNILRADGIWTALKSMTIFFSFLEQYFGERFYESIAIPTINNDKCYKRLSDKVALKFASF